MIGHPSEGMCEEKGSPMSSRLWWILIDRGKRIGAQRIWSFDVPYTITKTHFACSSDAQWV